MKLSVGRVVLVVQVAKKVQSAAIYVYNKTHWFTDKEAWTMFRLFAFAESIGWTMLIGAIVYKAFNLPMHDLAISVAGRIHGTFFIFYFIIVLISARSMGWGIWRLLGGLFAGMPPYTSLLFEQIMARHRRNHPVYIEPPLGYDE